MTRIVLERELIHSQFSGTRNRLPFLIPLWNVSTHLNLPSFLNYQPLKTAEQYIQNYQPFFEFQF